MILRQLIRAACWRTGRAAAGLEAVASLSTRCILIKIQTAPINRVFPYLDIRDSIKIVLKAIIKSYLSTLIFL